MKNKAYISIILFVLVSCSSGKKQEPAESKSANENIISLTDAQFKNADIVTGKMEQKEISTVLKLNGKIDVPPQNIISISVPLGGYLKSTKLLPGMHISKGEGIAIMEDQQYIQLQQDYLNAKVKIDVLENEFKRQKELNQNQASSDKTFQQAEAEYKSQKILIAALSQKLQLAGINVNTINESNIQRSVNIISPINGYVSKVNVNIGKYVAPTEVLFELIDPSDIHLALKVFEKDLDKLFIGQKLMTYTNNQPDKKHPCEIILIGKDLSNDRNADVHCHFKDYDKTLIPGTYMNADVEVKNNKVLALPSDAIVGFEGKNFVFKVVDKNRYEMTEIKVGESNNGYTEILNTTKNPAQLSDFVIKGAYSLLMMMKNKEE